MDNLYRNEFNVIHKVNDTEAEYPRNNTIHELFEKQVEKNPDNIAAIFGNEHLTYRELNIKSNQLAWLLRKKGVRRNQIVGIMVNRSMEMLIGIFGILKAGGAYLPISPDNPDKRIEYMLSDSGINILLTQSKFSHKCSTFKLDIINLEDKSIYDGLGNNIPGASSPNDLIYVIYTSGSTGKPKGVMIEHHSVVNRLIWMQEKYPIGENDTILQKTPFVFDVSVWELFWWSITGSRVCFLQPGFEKFPQAIIEEVEKSNITVLHFVPSMLNSFLNYVDGTEEVKRLKSLKQIFASGEELTVSHVKKFNRIIRSEVMAKLTNLYGPTEATVDVTYYDCPIDENIEKIPIGKPIKNIKAYIFRDSKLLPVGEIGELCISGEGLARGYLNNPELTKEKFVDNPVLKSQKMYRTGDLAMFLPDGNIEFKGRKDYQIKLRGLRIELGEIESIINEYKDVDQCAVIVKNKNSLNPAIVAFIVKRADFEIKDFKQYLKEHLPDYMVPNQYIFLDEMPLTTNGKINRNRLQEL